MSWLRPDRQTLKAASRSYNGASCTQSGSPRDHAAAHDVVIAMRASVKRNSTCTNPLVQDSLRLDFRIDGEAIVYQIGVLRNAASQRGELQRARLVLIVPSDKDLVHKVRLVQVPGNLEQVVPAQLRDDDDGEALRIAVQASVFGPCVAFSNSASHGTLCELTDNLATGRLDFRRLFDTDVGSEVRKVMLEEVRVVACRPHSKRRVSREGAHRHSQTRA
jgi:hypothetical protein